MLESRLPADVLATQADDTIVDLRRPWQFGGVMLEAVFANGLPVDDAQLDARGLEFATKPLVERLPVRRHVAIDDRDNRSARHGIDHRAVPHTSAPDPVLEEAIVTAAVSTARPPGDCRETGTVMSSTIPAGQYAPWPRRATNAVFHRIMRSKDSDQFST